MVYPSKLKEFADDNFKFGENGGKFSERGESTVGKEEISKDLYCRNVKTTANFRRFQTERVCRR